MASRGRSSRGTRRSGATKTHGRGRPARMHGNGRGGRATTAAKAHLSPRAGHSRHGPSIKKPDTYEALRRKGYSKAKAARISNAQYNGTINHRGGAPGRPK